MKRLIAFTSLMLLATSAFAFDSTKSAQRIGVLRSGHDIDPTMMRALVSELRGRGFDAFDAGLTYDELLDEEAVPIADYVIEIRGGEPIMTDHGGVGIDGRHAGVELGIVSSKVRAELIVYDGDTMQKIASNDLSKRTTALVPTSVGVGGGWLYAYVALPFIERAQNRSVAKKAARDAASFVMTTIRTE
ncbi:MAG: hypothetical protein ACJ74H_19685 [Thermoanaerobaculia bacterium]